METEVKIAKMSLLKQLVANAPFLETKHKNAYINLLEEQTDNLGYEENGFIYHVRPSTRESYNYWLSRYNENGQEILDLCKELDLPVNYKTALPDMSEVTIKPYGLSDKEKYKMNRLAMGDSPVDLPYGY